MAEAPGGGTCWRLEAAAELRLQGPAELLAGAGCALTRCAPVPSPPAWPGGAEAPAAPAPAAEAAPAPAAAAPAPAAAAPAAPPAPAAPAAPAPAPVAAAPQPREDGRIIATPYAKKLAKELGVDLATVAGSGPAGRITAADVEAAKARGGAPAPAAAAPAPAAAPAAAAPAPVAAAAAPAPAAAAEKTTVDALRGTTVPFTTLQKAVVNNMNESLKVRRPAAQPREHGCGAGGPLHGTRAPPPRRPRARACRRRRPPPPLSTGARVARLHQAVPTRCPSTRMPTVGPPCPPTALPPPTHRTGARVPRLHGHFHLLPEHAFQPSARSARQNIALPPTHCRCPSSGCPWPSPPTPWTSCTSS